MIPRISFENMQDALKVAVCISNELRRAVDAMEGEYDPRKVKAVNSLADILTAVNDAMTALDGAESLDPMATQPFEPFQPRSLAPWEIELAGTPVDESTRYLD